MNEKKLAGAHYIFTFYNSVRELSHWYAQYANLIKEIAHRFGGEVTKAADSEKNTVIGYAQESRYHVEQTYILLNSIKNNLNIEVNKDLDEAYKHCTEEFMPKTEMLRKYTIIMNETLVHSVIKELLENSQDFLKNIYENETAQYPSTGRQRDPQ